MPSRAVIDDFLAQQHVAFVGVSRDDKQFANAVYRHLRDGGRTLYPVNGPAEGAAIEGDVSYPWLADVPDPLDGVVVMVPPDRAADVVREALDRGAPRVWLYRGVGRGADTDEAVALCRERGVPVVDGACPFMFAAPVTGVHKWHGRFSRRRFSAA